MRRSVAAMTMTLLVAFDAACADVLWDNGLSYELGLGHLGLEGQRRSVLDDFAVVGADWSIAGVTVRGVSTAPGEIEEVALAVYADDGGRPDFDRLLVSAAVQSFAESPDPDAPKQFGLWPVILRIEIDPFELPAGRYWLDVHVANPRPWGQWIADAVRGGAAWVDYEDLGGRQQGRNIYGDDYDANFVLEGTIIPAPGALGVLACAVATRRRRRGRYCRSEI